MKKIIKALLVVTVIALALVAFTACEIPGLTPEAPACEHTGGTATCSKKAICELCGEAYGELAEHKPELLPAVEATCMNVGFTSGSKCSACGLVLEAQQKTELGDHNYVAVEALGETCYTDGYTAHTKCAYCGDEQGKTIIPGGHKWTADEATGNNVCSVCELVEVSTLDGLKAALANGGSIILAADIEVNANISLPADAVLDGNGHVLTGAQLYMGNNSTVKNVIFNGVCAENGSQIYAHDVSVVIDGCGFLNPDWDAIQATTTVDNVTFVITNCTFANTEGTAYRYVHVEVTDADLRAGANNVKLVLTGNHFANIDTCADDAITVVALEANVTAAENTATTCTQEGALAECWFGTVVDGAWAQYTPDLFAGLSAGHVVLQPTCTTPMMCALCGLTAGEALGHTDANADGKCETCEKYFLPEAGVAFKLKLVQANLGKVLYFTGEMSNYYYATGDYSQAADLYLEVVEGGYHIYMLDGETKNYLYVVASGTYINVKIGTTPEGVWTFNDELGTLVTTISGTDYYIGTYNTYNTISASKTSYISASNVDKSQFPARAVVVPEHECSYTEATCTILPTCTICGLTSGELAAHTYEDKVTAPTCTAAGYTTHTCTACGHSYNDNEVEATGHTTAEGVCDNCGQTVGSAAPVVGTLATFDFGANGSASHVDGSDLGTSKSYTEGDYTLALTSLSKVFGPAYDAKGNSCIKLGTSSKTGTFTFTVPENVTEVVIYVAGYKAATSTSITINGTSYSVKTASNNGEYTAITIDTTTTKTITFTTVTYRCMINTIVFNGYAN